MTTLSFQSLGLSEARVQFLEQQGFSNPTPIQAQAIPQLLAGRDVMGLAQTGTGKTAAFSLPILERIDPRNHAVQALILTPTRELAVQVCAAVRGFADDRRVRILPIYGGQSIDLQISRLQRGVQIVVGTPGRVIDLMNRGDLKLDQISWFVLDEADEMLNMGFIQDVEKILSQAPSERQTAFFSATMDPSIRKLVAKFLRSPVNVTIEQPKAAPSRINQVVYMVPRGWTKSRSLQPVLELEDPESAIIFVRTRKAAAELTSQLQAAGHSVDEYHGDLTQSQRERLLLRFKQRQVRWIVATDIAARGIHVDDLTHVINYDLPDSVDNYVHRIGRTGRAGKEGTALSLVHPLDKRKLRDIENHIRQKLDIRNVPTRAEIEAKHLEKLKTQLAEAVAGERMASFLPIVSQLSEEGYETHAIAAAALQLYYDKTRPNWMNASADPTPEELAADRPMRNGGGGSRRFRSDDRRGSGVRGRSDRGGDRRPRNNADRGNVPRPVLKK
ncbi:DEAD/DEAH box helicase [Alkalinema sp. FACHB-956]|uniref:DEAD/DEAH box helicase n=1 Tax=Alkalinema sp. FACHB-956 TaxID=2692768 RepID=UPI00168341A1|nr:DEAD/DEAH box helicase [Alkalinema sp. FACHB-956]MBD2326971.1 DEAD/DEAH box helicase [Alkalinema sp. FACHB-956]